MSKKFQRIDISEEEYQKIISITKSHYIVDKETNFIGVVKKNKYSYEIRYIMTYCKVLRKIIDIGTKQIKIEYEYHNGIEIDTIQLDGESLSKFGLKTLLSYGVRFNETDIDEVNKYLMRTDMKAEIVYGYSKLGWDKIDNSLVFRYNNLIAKEPTKKKYIYNGNLCLNHKGSLDEWCNMIQNEVCGNIPMSYLLMASFASPLLSILNFSHDFGSILFCLCNNSSKTKKGLPFVKNSLYEILKNEKYKGTYIFNRSCSANALNKRNNHRRKPEEEIIRIENGCPAIVSSGLWHRANAVKKATRSSYTNAKNTYLLTGLIHCGECGGKFHGNVRYNKNNTNLVYRCSSKKNKRKCESKEIRCEYLDSFVIDKFVEFFFNDDNIKVITKQLNEQYNKSCISDLEYNEAKSTLKILEKSRNNLVEAIAKTGINDIMSDKIKEYEEQIKKTAEFIQKYEKQKIDRVITEDEVRKQINHLKDYFYNPKNLIRTKYVLSQYIDRIDISNENVQVQFKVSMSPSDNTDGDCFCVHTEMIKRKYLFDYVCEKVDFEQWNIEKLNKSESEHRKGA